VVSAVTVAELAFGLDVDDLVERRARTDRFYAVLREMSVLPFDLAAARLYGTLVALVRRAGRNPRPRRTDLQIAATAGAHALPLVTRNPADFVGLERLVPIVPA
jgi:predicted nucleic acid-binding protein